MVAGAAVSRRLIPELTMTNLNDQQYIAKSFGTDRKNSLGQTYTSEKVMSRLSDSPGRQERVSSGENRKSSISLDSRKGISIPVKSGSSISDQTSDDGDSKTKDDIFDKCKPILDIQNFLK